MSTTHFFLLSSLCDIAVVFRMTNKMELQYPAVACVLLLDLFIISITAVTDEFNSLNEQMEAMLNHHDYRCESTSLQLRYLFENGISCGLFFFISNYIRYKSR